MAAEGPGHLDPLGLDQVVASADVVDVAQLDHEVVQRRDADLEEGQAVMTGVGVEERRLERRHHVVGEPEAQHVGVEADGRLQLRHHQHHVAQPQLAGLEPRDVAAGRELPGAVVGAAEQLDPVPGRIVAVDHARHPPALQLGLGPLGDRHPGRLQLPGGGVEGGGAGHLPPVAEPVRPVGRLDGDAVVALVHTEMDHVAVARLDLHAEHMGGEPGPVVRILGRDPQVPERLDVHRPH